MQPALKWTLGILVFLLLIAITGFFTLDESMPEGIEGPQAEALADKMLVATNKAAWDTTRLVSWDFGGRHQFRWKRSVDSVDVTWGEYEVKLHTKTVTGKAYKNGVLLNGSKADELIQDAWSYFCNDSFWLAAPYKIHDPGTRRSIVNLEDGNQALLVTYDGGGVTPGDSYLWLLDDAGLPTSWKMWTQIIPIGGVEASWENYKTLPSGAVIAQTHKLPIFTLELTGIQEN